MNDSERTLARRRFQDPKDPCWWFIGQCDTGGEGIKLTQGQRQVFYSNSFDLKTRLQCESRSLEVGQTQGTLYLDLVVKNTLDVRVRQALRSKKSLADEITGDTYKEWI